MDTGSCGNYYNLTMQYGLSVGNKPRSVAIDDLDGDGSLDLAVVNEYSNNISVLLGNGDGSFADAVDYCVGGVAYSVAIGDLDSDGILDLGWNSSINTSSSRA